MGDLPKAHVLSTRRFSSFPEPSARSISSWPRRPSGVPGGQHWVTSIVAIAPSSHPSRHRAGVFPMWSLIRIATGGPDGSSRIGALPIRDAIPRRISSRQREVVTKRKHPASVTVMGPQRVGGLFTNTVTSDLLTCPRGCSGNSYNCTRCDGPRRGVIGHRDTEPRRKLATNSTAQRSRNQKISLQGRLRTRRSSLGASRKSGP